MKNNFMKSYGFLLMLVTGIVSGCVVGAVFPGAKVFAPLGQVFINFMFCLVVPMVFAAVSSTVANMESLRQTGKIMGVTLGVFVLTGLLAAVLMFVLMQLIPPVLKPWTSVAPEEIAPHSDFSELFVLFFTAEDFSGLLSRKAMLPLLFFAVLFGFAVHLCGGKASPVGKGLNSMAEVLLKLLQIATYYAPVAFFGFFANLVATYGPEIAGAYGRGLALYYPLCAIYMVTVFPLFAQLGGGRGGAKTYFRHILRPAMVSLGTCSSIATVPTNMDAAEKAGISKEIAGIVMPLGATMHMDGSCFSCVLKIAFVYGVLGLDFTWGMILPVLAVAVVSSVAMSGVPGGSYVGEYIICVLFFPGQMELAFPILVTIGNLVDPPATMINATGDFVASFLVSRYADGKKWLKRVKK